LEIAEYEIVNESMMTKHFNEKGGKAMLLAKDHQNEVNIKNKLK
jgi:hypothetical protein